MKLKSQYSSPGEFKKKDPRSYNYIIRNNLLEKVCEMYGWKITKKKPVGYWTKEKCLAISRKCNSLKEWKELDSASVDVARRKNWYEECISHMKFKNKRPNYWTVEKVLKDAKKYNTRKEWRKHSKAGYRAAQRLGCLVEATKHMNLLNKGKNYWNKEKCLEEAKKYKTKTEWYKSHRYSHRLCKLNGWFEEATKHMK